MLNFIAHALQSELNKVSIANYVKFRLQTLSSKIERAFENTTKFSIKIRPKRMLIRQLKITIINVKWESGFSAMAHNIRKLWPDWIDRVILIFTIYESNQDLKIYHLPFHSFCSTGSKKGLVLNLIIFRHVVTFFFSKIALVRILSHKSE